MSNRYKKWEEEKDSQKEEIFTNSLNSLHTAMEDHTDDAKRYLLKVLLEQGKKEWYDNSPLFLSDIGYIKTIVPDVSRDVAKEYNRKLFYTIEWDFFNDGKQGINVKSKYNIAKLINDLPQKIIIWNNEYRFDLNEDGRLSYFKQKNIDIDALIDDPDSEEKIMEKISQFLYWKPYKSLFWLQTDPQNTYIIGEGWQLKLRFE